MAIFVAGPLADRLMEPAMMPGGALAPALGLLVGTSPGAGMALIFLVAGFMGATTSLGGYLFKAVRKVEDMIPDHDQALETVVAVNYKVKEE